MVSVRAAGALALALLPLSTVIAAPGGKEVPPAVRALPRAAFPASVRVLSGRATLVQGAEIATLTRASARREVDGEAYVEVGPLAELELAWSGSASLRVSGPAALEWGPGDEVRVLRAERLELEVRRGERLLRLPSGWSLRVARAALSLAESVSGDWTVDHRGGQDATVERHAKPAGALASGKRALLTRD